MRSSVRARTSAAWNDSALRSAIETWAANSLTSSNSSLGRTGVSLPDPLDRQHAGRAVRPEQRHDDQAAVDRARVPEVVDPARRSPRPRSAPARCAPRPRSRCRSRPAPTGPGSGRRGRRGRSAAGGGPCPAPRPRSRCCRTGSASPSRSVICSRTARPSSVVRIDSVIRSSSPWARAWRSNAADCSRIRAVASALAIAWAANDA